MGIAHVPQGRRTADVRFPEACSAEMFCSSIFPCAVTTGSFELRSSVMLPVQARVKSCWARCNAGRPRIGRGVFWRALTKMRSTDIGHERVLCGLKPSESGQNNSHLCTSKMGLRSGFVKGGWQAAAAGRKALNDGRVQAVCDEVPLASR